MKHEYSVEILYHFNCGVCKNWWSFATTPAYLKMELGLPNNMEYFCPHCGADETVEIKRGIFDEKILTS